MVVRRGLEINKEALDGIQRAKVLDDAHAQQIEMDVAGQFKQVGLFLTENGLIAILEKLTVTAEAVVEHHGITGEQATHQGCQRRIRSTD